MERPRPPKPKPKMSSEAICDKLRGSRQVACTIRDAKRLQRCWAWPLVLDEEGVYEDGSTEEETELAAASYKYSVRQLANAFPKVELDVAALVKGVPCNNDNSEPCECGEGRCGVFPWEVWTRRMKPSYFDSLIVSVSSRWIGTLNWSRPESPGTQMTLHIDWSI